MSILSHKKTDVAAVYDKYANLLYRVALTHVRCEEDAQDIIQDVFAKYITASPVFNDDEYERAWFIRVTVNRCRDILRRNKLRNHLPIDDYTHTLEDKSNDNSSMKSEIISTLNALPEKYKTVIVLHHFEDLTVEQTAKALGLSVSAVKMRLSRGREQLKIILEKEAIQ